MLLRVFPRLHGLRVVVGLWLLVSLSAHANTAFFYSNKPPIAELAAHTTVVLDPRLVEDSEVAALRATGTNVFAYVSIGEIEPSDPFYSSLPAAAVLTTNPGWQTSVMDLAHPAWRALILDKRIAPLANRGFNGLFLDTLDSYHLTDQRPAQKRALADLLAEVQRQHPKLQLLLNRGFEILDQLPKTVRGVVAESLYKSFNAATQEYTDVSATDREWLLARFEESRDYAKEIIAIDYLPTLGEEAQATAKKIRQHKVTPWVTDPSLTNLGISNLVPVPRRVLVLHNDTGKKLAARDAHTLFGATLDWYGYVAEFHNIRDGEPRLVKGVHAASMMWLTPNDTASHSWFDDWLRGQAAGPFKVLMLGILPTRNSKTLEAFGLKENAFSRPVEALSINSKDELVGDFEAKVRLRKYEIANVRSTSPANEVHLEIGVESGDVTHPVITGPWGGLVHHPYLIEDFGAGRRRFIIDPFKLVAKAFSYTPRPVLDTTTQNGRRILTIHVDGDGFASRAFLPGSPLSGNVLLDQFIANTDLPHTISVIEGEVGEAGLYPESHEEFESIARRIFREPNVELASHSYSHPFYWQTSVLGSSDKAIYGLHLPIPNYTVDLKREIVGSVDYINLRLAPPGKEVKVFLWSGSADPDDVALKIVEDAGLVNVNGGNTTALEATATVTTIWPQARRENGGLQVYAAIMNENVYTNDWTGPYYGFRKVIETFDLTDAPRRLKPLCIYYHFYSATKPASIKALREVYDAAIDRNPFPIYLSEFAELVKNYYDASVSKTLDGQWLLQNAGALRTLRVPRSMGYADSASTDIAGYLDVNEDRYLHLEGPSARLSFSDKPAKPLQLASANADLRRWELKAPKEVALRFVGHTNVEFEIYTKTSCTLALANNTRFSAQASNGKAAFKLTTKDTGNAHLVCK